MNNIAQENGLARSGNHRSSRKGRYSALPVLILLVALLVGSTSAAGATDAKQEDNRSQGATESSLPSKPGPGRPLAPMAENDRFTPALAYNSAGGEYLVVWYDERISGNSDIYAQRVSSSGALVGSEIPISTAAERQDYPAVAYNSTSGEYLVVWSDYRGGSASDIYGQRVSGSGALLGTNFPISTATDYQDRPAVALNSAGEYLVVWQDERTEATDRDIYGQRVSSGGALAGSNFPISTLAESQDDPDLAYNSTSNEYLVVWRDARVPGLNHDIYGQRVSATGTLTGSEIAIFTEDEYQQSPAVAYNSTANEYLVVLQDQRDALGGGSDIFGQRVSGSGALAGSPIQITVSFSSEWNPSVAYNSTGNEYLVAWQDSYSGQFGGTNVSGRRVLGSGALAGGIISITLADNIQDYPSVAYNSTNNEYLAVWQDRRRGINYDIYAQRVSGSGALAGTNFSISTAEGGEDEPAVAYNSAGNEYLVVWHDLRSNTFFDIFAQRVSSSGSLIGDEIPISTAADDQAYPSVVYNSATGEYLIVWQDRRTGTYDIYGQRVSGSGALVGGNFTISTATGGQGFPNLALNSAGTEYLVVWQDGRVSEFDIYGQRVSSGGALTGSEIPVSTAAEGQYFPIVAHNSAGTEYLVVWQDDRGGGSNNDLYGQRISSSGALSGGEIPVATAAGNQLTPAMSYNSASNEYLVAWTILSGSNYDIYGQRLSGSGAPVGGQIPLITGTGHQEEPALAYNSAGNEYLLVWSHYVSSTTEEEIYGRRVSSSGALQGSEIVVATAPEGQVRPALAYGGAGNQFLVAWTDYRDPATNADLSDIYAQRVTTGGALSGSNFTITGEAPPAVCTLVFSDVPEGSTFYTFVQCLACREILGGYADGTFRPQNQITRGQIAKIVSNAAGYSDDVTSRHTYTDVPAGSTFHQWIERLSMRGHMGGYACGGPGEPCDTQNQPYFRPGNNATRGQLSKIVSNAAGHSNTPTAQTFEDVPTNSAFYLFIERLSGRGAMGGYVCGGVGEPCVAPNNRPYFRPGDNVTRGQASKIVANTFFPECAAD